MDNKLSDVQKRIMVLLSDGMPHDAYEIFDCLSERGGRLSGIQWHLSTIRRLIRPLGYDILTELYNNCIHYRQVILLVHPRAVELLHDLGSIGAAEVGISLPQSKSEQRTTRTKS